MSKKSALLTILIAAALFAPAMASPAWGVKQMYRDYSLGTLAMIAQSIIYDEARLYVIGESSTPGIYQTAMLISQNPDREDAGTKNAVVFECGMHGREFFAAESCYWLIDYLLQKRGTSLVTDLLANADIWVIPQSNPAGRMIDDVRWGDPTQFYYFCDDGTRAGLPCTSDTDCTGGGTCWTQGWRSNANQVDCALGVDLARNFSSGWDIAPPLCEKELCVGGVRDGLPCTGGCPGGSCKNRRMWYRGTSPFSEPETLNLRQFIHNHMISMGAVVHTNGQTLWNLWESNNPTSYMLDRLISINNTGSLGYAPDPAMSLDNGLGGSNGQFSAWLSQSSNVAGEPDATTSRNISTFFFELPVENSAYQAPYQNRVDDGSNSFHPSGDTMRFLWEDAIRHMFLYTIVQASSPQCPVELFPGLGLARIDSQCEPRDFGLVGAKIADGVDLPGLLKYDAGSRWETINKGVHRVFFAVQNFSSAGQSNPPTQLNALVVIAKDGSNVYNTVPITLDPGQRSVYSVEYDFDYGDYRVSILLDSDDFISNNSKSFTFRVPSLQLQPLEIRLGLSNQHISPAGSFTFNGTFPADRELNPLKAGLNLVVYAHRSQPSDNQVGAASVSYDLPKGARWWRKSLPAKGLWIYSDPKRTNGAVTSLVFQQPPKKGLERKARATVIIAAKDSKLKGLCDAQSYRVDLNFKGDNFRLSSLARGAKPPLLKRDLLPEGETEEEPHDNPINQDQ